MTLRRSATGSSSNYLTRAGRGSGGREHAFRKCNALFSVLFTLKGMREVASGQLRVLQISEKGMRATSHRNDIPDHLYLCIGDRQIHIGCAIVSRKRGMLEIRFLNELPTAFVREVASLEDPFALLKEIRPALFGLDGFVN
ncbi:hypothetical protein [Hoeflea sp.]|uniref:hypothetical protein n=1 Tax=Hoeflea sp. TaxID=1940281 RepID=UPI003B516B64